MSDSETFVKSAKRFVDRQMQRLQIGKHRPGAPTATGETLRGLPTRQKIMEVSDRYRAKHRQYVSGVSTSEMAASLECLAFCVALCENREVSRVLDCGSGFSSFVLREAARSQKESSRWEVLSIDDDADWIAATQRFLAREGHQDATLISLDEFTSRDIDSSQKFDFIFYDLGRMEARFANLVPFARYLAQDAVMYVDDVHKTKYRQYVEQSLHGGTLFSVRNLTLDRINRYGYVFAAHSQGC